MPTRDVSPLPALRERVEQKSGANHVSSTESGPGIRFRMTGTKITHEVGTRSWLHDDKGMEEKKSDKDQSWLTDVYTPLPVFVAPDTPATTTPTSDKDSLSTETISADGPLVESTVDSTEPTTTYESLSSVPYFGDVSEEDNDSVSDTLGVPPPVPLPVSAKDWAKLNERTLSSRYNEVGEFVGASGRDKESLYVSLYGSGSGSGSDSGSGSGSGSGNKQPRRVRKEDLTCLPALVPMSASSNPQFFCTPESQVNIMASKALGEDFEGVYISDGSRSEPEITSDVDSRPSPSWVDFGGGSPSFGEQQVVLGAWVVIRCTILTINLLLGLIEYAIRGLASALKVVYCFTEVHITPMLGPAAAPSVAPVLIAPIVLEVKPKLATIADANFRVLPFVSSTLTTIAPPLLSIPWQAYESVATYIKNVRKAMNTKMVQPVWMRRMKKRPRVKKLMTPRPRSDVKRRRLAAVARHPIRNGAKMMRNGYHGKLPKPFELLHLLERTVEENPVVPVAASAFVAVVNAYKIGSAFMSYVLNMLFTLILVLDCSLSFALFYVALTEEFLAYNNNFCTVLAPSTYDAHRKSLVNEQAAPLCLMHFPDPGSSSVQLNARSLSGVVVNDATDAAVTDPSWISLLFSHASSLFQSLINPSACVQVELSVAPTELPNGAFDYGLQAVHVVHGYILLLAGIQLALVLPLFAEQWLPVNAEGKGNGISCCKIYDDDDEDEDEWEDMGSFTPVPALGDDVPPPLMNTVPVVDNSTPAPPQDSSSAIMDSIDSEPSTDDMTVLATDINLPEYMIGLLKLGVTASTPTAYSDNSQNDLLSLSPITTGSNKLRPYSRFYLFPKYLSRLLLTYRGTLGIALSALCSAVAHSGNCLSSDFATEGNQYSINASSAWAVLFVTVSELALIGCLWENDGKSGGSSGKSGR